MKYYRLILLVILISFVSFSFSSDGYLSDENNYKQSKITSKDRRSDLLPIYDKEVLILHAYQRDYAHTKAIDEGIEAYFNDTELEVKFRYEYLDTKNYFNQSDLSILSHVLSNKYANNHFDAIIICDDDALNFYLSYGDKIWRDTEIVVATGINSLSPHENQNYNITIVEEKPKIEETIELALKQNEDKSIRNLHFIYDETTTSLIMEN